MVTRLLNLCGMNLGPEEGLLPPLADNLAGFWENIAAGRINEAVLEALGGGWDYLPHDVKPGWENHPGLEPLREKARALISSFSGHEPWGWKDPRLCLTLPFWQPLLPDYRVIICVRHPLDIAGSLMRRNGLSRAFSLHLWHEHNQHVLEHTGPEQRLVTHYDIFFADPQNELRRIVDWLGWTVDEETVLKACESISQKLRHHHSPERHGQPGNLPADVARLYQTLLSEAGLKESPVPAEASDTRAGSTRPLVSIVMLTFNVLEYTKRCVDSLRQHTNYPHEVIFVDNGSTDETRDYLRSVVEANPNYRLIENDTNAGFSAGNNQGVRAASGEHVLLLNNDVLVGDGWLDSMVNALERDECIGMVGPITNYISGRQLLEDVAYEDDEGFYGFASTVRTANQDKVTPRRRIAGFAMLIRKALYDELDGLDENFGSGNYEDDDLCLRMREKGYAIMVDEGTYLHHFGSRTFVGNKIDYQASLKKNEAIFRAKWPDVDLDWLLEKEESLVQILDRKVEEAIGHINREEMEAAQELCREILREDPTKVEAIHSLGLIAHLSGNLREARNYYQRAVSLNRAWKPVQQSLALLDLADGDLQNAVLRLTQLVEQDPHDLDARRLLGQTLIEAERFEEGIGILMGVLKDDPNDWQTHLSLASLYTEVERTEDVKRHLEAVLAANPDHVQAREMLEKVDRELQVKREAPGT